MNECNENPELRIGYEEARAEAEVNREYNERREKWEKRPLTPTMSMALGLALKHGAVWAGRNETTHGGYRTVSTPTLFGLERRGLLVLQASPDGTMMGRPTDKAIESRDR